MVELMMAEERRRSLEERREAIPVKRSGFECGRGLQCNKHQAIKKVWRSEVYALCKTVRNTNNANVAWLGMKHG